MVLDTRRSDVCPGQRVLLAHAGRTLAVLDVESAWAPDKAAEAAACYGTACLGHPGARMIATERGPVYLGGRLHGLALPQWCRPCFLPVGCPAAATMCELDMSGTLPAALPAISLRDLTCSPRRKEEGINSVHCHCPAGSSRARPRRRCGPHCRPIPTWWPSSAATRCTGRTTSCSPGRLTRPTCPLALSAW